MRIIAGKLGGRQFDSPKSFKTHPMSDKIRGALFNMLGDIEKLSVLDAFAGSGALSFEAASRGAGPITAIDSDRAAQKAIAQNIVSLQLRRNVRLINASANAWLETNPEAHFDIVLCDPPYNDLQPNLLARLAERITEHGILVISWPGSTTPPELSGVDLIDQRSYGDAQLLFYKNA